MYKRSISVLMVCCMIISMFTTGCVKSVMTVEWTKPVAGMTPASFENACLPEAKYNGQDIPCRVSSWTDVTDGGIVLMDPQQDRFAGDHEYQAAVELQIPAGLNLKPSDVTSNTQGYLPGMTWEKADHLIEVTFRFTIKAKSSDSDILSITVTDPAKGKTPAEIEKDGATVLFNGKKIQASFSEWRIYDMKRSDEGTAIDLETPFEPGYYYSVLLMIDQPENYSREKTEIRSEAEVQEEGGEKGKLAMRLFFDQLAYKEISPEITIETAAIRSGTTVKEANQLLKVLMGEVEVGDTEFTWSMRRNGDETVLEETDLLKAEDQTAYALDVRFVLPPNIKNDDFSLQISGSCYHYHSGLMTRSGNNRTYGCVRIVYESEDFLPSKAEVVESDIFVQLPSLIGAEKLDEIEEGISIYCMNRPADEFTAEWGAYIGNQLYNLDKNKNLLNGSLTFTEGEEKVDREVDYYLLTLNFPMVHVHADDMKVVVDCEGSKTSWGSFWQEESGREMAQVTILIDPDRLIRKEAPSKGIQHIFLYVPELYPGMTLEEINSHLLLMIGGAAYTNQETVWTLGTDEENPVVLKEEDTLRWEDEDMLPALKVRISSGNVNEESIRRLNADVFGVDPEKSPYELTLDPIAKKVDLTVKDLECGKAFVKIVSPVVYSGAAVEFDPSAFQVIWTDEYQTVQLENAEIGWRVSDKPFDPETADADGEETIWEGENFESGRHYVADLYAYVPENRKGTGWAQVFSAPSLSLMSSASVIREQEDGSEILCAHLAVEPSYRDSEGCIEHSFVVNEEESIEATCSEEGLRVSYCENCGVKLEEVLPAAEHDTVYDAAASRTADCSREGLEVYSCRRCGARWEEVTPKLSHEMWISDAQSTPATCQSAGTQVLICAKCGYRTTQTLPKTSHHYTVTEETPAGCETMGVRTHTCSECGENYQEYTPALGHHYQMDETQSTPSTCSQEGTAVMICSTCGKRGEDKVLPLAEHSYELITIYPATCYAEGAATNRCSICGHEDDSVITLPRTEHHMVEGEGEAPTCTHEGTSVTYCSNEGCTYREETPIPRLSHHFEGGHCVWCYEPDPYYTESSEEISDNSEEGGEPSEEIVG